MTFDSSSQDTLTWMTENLHGCRETNNELTADDNTTENQQTSEDGGEKRKLVRQRCDTSG